MHAPSHPEKRLRSPSHPRLLKSKTGSQASGIGHTKTDPVRHWTRSVHSIQDEMKNKTRTAKSPTRAFRYWLPSRSSRPNLASRNRQYSGFGLRLMALRQEFGHRISACLLLPIATGCSETGPRKGGHAITHQIYTYLQLSTLIYT
jgi:hypothetical protein